MLAKISDIKGLNLESRHPIIKDVLYSLAVQHGETGGANLIYNALPLDVNYFSDEDIINKGSNTNYIGTSSKKLSVFDKTIKKALEYNPKTDE